MLLDRHFPKNHELHKICNRNTIKISYSCMDNMEKLIKAHNAKLINTHTQQKHPTCNCRNKENCPLPGQCTANNIIYEAKVTTQHSFKTYIGLTSNTFKTRYSSHKTSFNNQRHMNDTELSKYVWDLKETGTQYKITWKILRHAEPYNPKSQRCQLCLWEKYFIITSNRQTTLNKRSELISTCKHRKKFLLSEYGWTSPLYN